MTHLGRTQSVATLVAVVSLSPGAWAQSRSRYSWEAEDSRYGFAVYTSEVPDHSYDAIKVVTVLDVSAPALVDALQDFANYTRCA